MLTPSFMPHEYFHKCSWLMPETHSKWYYYKLRDKNNFDIKYKNFSKSLDKELIDIVNFLYNKGIITTPSCAGHFSDISYYEKIFDLIKKDEKKIKDDGCYFFDYETGKYYFYQNNYYKINFELDEFCETAMEHQKSGVIGLTSKDESILKVLKNLEIKNFNKKIDDNIIIFMTKSNNEKEKINKWNLFSNEINKKLTYL
jgi:hypothetical protein